MGGNKAEKMQKCEFLCQLGIRRDRASIGASSFRSSLDSRARDRQPLSVIDLTAYEGHNVDNKAADTGAKPARDPKSTLHRMSVQHVLKCADG